MDQQCHYVGLDVSLETTSICVIDDAGAIIWRGKCRSDPDTITAIVRQHAPGAVRVGLETGQLSNWLTLSLRRRGVPVVCMDARHAKAAPMVERRSPMDCDLRQQQRNHECDGGRGKPDGPDLGPAMPQAQGRANAASAVRSVMRIRSLARSTHPLSSNTRRIRLTISRTLPSSSASA